MHKSNKINFINDERHPRWRITYQEYDKAGIRMVAYNWDGSLACPEVTPREMYAFLLGAASGLRIRL